MAKLLQYFEDCGPAFYICLFSPCAAVDVVTQGFIQT